MGLVQLSRELTECTNGGSPRLAGRLSKTIGLRQVVAESTQLRQNRKAAKNRKVKSWHFFAVLVRFATSGETAVSVGTPSAASDVGDHVDLNERIAGNSSGGDGSSHRRFGAETPLEDFIHARVILQVRQVNVALEALFHGRADLLELLLDLVEDTFSMHFDITRLMVSYAGDEDQVAVGDHSVE